MLRLAPAVTSLMLRLAPAVTAVTPAVLVLILLPALAHDIRQARAAGKVLPAYLSGYGSMINPGMVGRRR